MTINKNEVLQWIGAVLIIGGHALNSVGPSAYPWNIVSFVVGTALFTAWAHRVGNKPQLTVNVISIAIMGVGLYKAWG
jgi:hypothetical protein